MATSLDDQRRVTLTVAELMMFMFVAWDSNILHVPIAADLYHAAKQGRSELMLALAKCREEIRREGERLEAERIKPKRLPKKQAT